MGVVSRMLVGMGLKKKEEVRAILLGLDCSGKTSLLYRYVHGKVTNTVPTIGFNVESVDIHGRDVTFWDVGGCDKIRPLWRHYYPNTRLVVLVVDACDRDRMEAAREDFAQIDAEAEFAKSIMIAVFNKQDLPSAMSLEECREVFGLNQPARSHWHSIAISVRRDATLTPLSDLIHEALENPKKRVVSSPADDPHQSSDNDKKQDPLEQRFLSWLEVEDEPDDEFEEKLVSYALSSWDHRTHLRLAWMHLKKYGRREGMRLIFERIANYIANSSHTNGRTFHETMTYFWAHMVHYAMATSSLVSEDFKTFLLTNPQLANGGLFLEFYSKDLMLHTPKSRSEVVLPDKKQLPSLITITPNPDSKEIKGKPSPLYQRKDLWEAADDEFVMQVERGLVPGWNHECLLRLIYRTLAVNGRDTNECLEVIRKVEKSSFHFTINCFWIQLVHYTMVIQGLTLDASAPPFYEFQAGKGYENITNSQAFLQHYSHDRIFSKQAEAEMVLPDLVPLPNCPAKDSANAGTSVLRFWK